MFPYRSRRMLCLCVPALLSAFCASVMAATTAPDATEAATPPAVAPPATTTMKGKILSLNFGGRGEAEGFMLESSPKPVQINIPNEMADIFKTLHPGDSVEVGVQSADSGPHPGPAGPADAQGTPDHDVFDAISLKDAQGHTFLRAGPDGRGAGASVKIQSTVRALNYDHRGVADGLQLASGELVRLGGAAAKLNLAPGQSVTVEGDVEQLPGGGKLIHPTSINGQTVTDAPAPPPGDRGGPPPMGRGGPPSADTTGLP